MKIAIFSSSNFQPIYMVKNYVTRLHLLYRPFAGFDPEYDEHITILTNVKTLTDAALVIAAGLEGFEVNMKPMADILTEADKIVVFCNNNKDLEIVYIINKTIELRKNLEIYFSPKEK